VEWKIREGERGRRGGGGEREGGRERGERKGEKERERGRERVGTVIRKQAP